jgi:uncharacterized protein YjbI with pentapeptide repeats
MNDQPEEFSFGGSSLFGYEKIVRHGDRYTLEGEDVPSLQQGMVVELCGNSRGYVPGGFRDGEKAEIVAFRQPFQDGASDEIIRVTNGERAGWVKPSNLSLPQRLLKEAREIRMAEEDDNLAPVPDDGPANPLHIGILQKGAQEWNRWRLANPHETPRLAGADLRGPDLRHINLEGADLSSIEGFGVDLYHANLKSANLRRAFLQCAKPFKANLSGANLEGSSIAYADLGMAKLKRAILTNTNCGNCDLSAADCSYADLTLANLDYARLFDTNFSGATLVETSLMATLMIRTNLKGATLQGCRVHGAAVWKVETDLHTLQKNLIVTDLNDPTVTTDNLEIAQLIHLLINASAIRDVINSMTGRAVLLLGRFIPERMSVLSAVADRLRQLGDLPIIFNFDKPVDLSVTETLRILAGLSKFIIADLTDPKSSPYESHVTVPDMAIPFVPIIQQGQDEFSMFEDLYDYDWLLEGFAYRDINHLLDNIEALRQEALAKREIIREKRNNRPKGFRTELSGQMR